MSPTEVYALSRDVQAFVTRVHERIQDGLTIADAAKIVFDGLKLAIRAMDGLPLDGAERKQSVMQFAGSLFDICADKVVAWYAVPLWLIVRPAVRSLVLSIASEAIEAMLPLIRGDE